ncbi:hypothetical protein MMC11_006806 [Xylographa trunciseda]|nr:hypothetical protein [Xylographa trunciseda]
MSELIRDTVFGHLLRYLTGGKLFPYAEDRDPSLWKRYIHDEKTMRMAHHGHTGEEKAEEQEQADTTDAPRSREGISRDSSATRRESNIQTNALGHPIDPENGRDTNVNPMNWSLCKKVLVTFEICLLTFSVYIGSAIYTAGIEGVVAYYDVSQVKVSGDPTDKQPTCNSMSMLKSSLQATLGLTLFVAGYGLGPMLWAPLSEIPQIGRNPVYIGTLFAFVVLQIPVALATNFAMLLCFRFLTGFVGSPVLATGGASIGDIYTPRKRAYGIAVWGLSAVCGPVLGPLVGGFAAQNEQWNWTIWELTWLSGFTLMLLILFLPETSSANILYRRARRLRVLTRNQNLKSEPEIAGENMTGKEIAMISLVRPFTLNFTEPMVFLLNLYIALIYGLLYIWFESFPIVFEDIYGFSLELEGVAFVGILIGAAVAIPPFFWYLYKYVEPQFNVNGELKPEIRLQAACVGGFFIPICLFWFGWSAKPSISWIMPIIGSGFFAVGTLLLFNSVLNYLGDAYPDYAASVLAGNDLMRSSFGAGFPLFASAMYNNLGVAWASSTLAFLSIAFIPIPFVLYFYGERLRKMSKHARKDF